MHSVAPLRAIVPFFAGHGAIHFIRWAVIAGFARKTMTLFLVWTVEARLTRLRLRRARRGKESWWGDGLVGSF